jgi:N-acyl-D-amino-acid deacylase
VEAVSIARSSGASVHISHFKAIGRKAWHDLQKALIILRKAREEEGLDITVDFFPYIRTGSLLYTLLPEWILEGGRENILNVLRDQSKRTMVLDSIKNLTLHYENITIAEARKDKNIIGKTIQQISENVGLSLEETFVQLLVTNDLGVTIFGKTLASANVLSIAKEDYSMFSSDGVGDDHTVKRRTPDLTHPRSYGAAPRFLNRIVRRKNVLSWEDAVKKMTGMPATRLGIGESRGFLRKGYAADIVIIDPETIEDRATYADPYQLPVGIEYVFVNGNCAVEKGVFTGSLAGKILRQV